MAARLSNTAFEPKEMRCHERPHPHHWPFRRQVRDVHRSARFIQHRVRQAARAAGRDARPVSLHDLRRAASLRALPASPSMAWRSNTSRLIAISPHLIELNRRRPRRPLAAWAAKPSPPSSPTSPTICCPQVALAQFRALGLHYAFIHGGVVRMPLHTPAPSGAFIGESVAIPVGALILSIVHLEAEKGGGDHHLHRANWRRARRQRRDDPSRVARR